MTSGNTSLTPVIAGFIPLLDAAVLIAAKEKGIAARHGIDLNLIRETSWANIRDRIAVGHFDVAHMLAPMPIAATLELTSLAVPMTAPMLLGLGGNAITVSEKLASDMVQAGWGETLDAINSGEALAKVVAKRKSEGRSKLRFGVVHPFSGHAYELRYWLAYPGLDPDIDVEISVLPPPVMPDALKTSQLDGYCVGEPWNTIAISAGHGVMVTCKQEIWPNSPEKVLGVTEAWAKSNPKTRDALINSLDEAAKWCAIPGNHSELANILGSAAYLDCGADACLPALTGNLMTARDRRHLETNFFQFAEGPRAIPQQSQALWFYAQMVRWGQANFNVPDSVRAASVFGNAAPNLVQSDTESQAMPMETPVQLFDGRKLYQNDLEDYILSFQKT